MELTPEMLFHSYWNNNFQAIGLKYFRKFTSFHLHRVGLLNNGNPFDNLLYEEHKSLLETLCYQRKNFNFKKLSKEIMIFLFDVKQTGFSTELFSSIRGENNPLVPKYVSKERNVQDAAKAFNEILDSKHTKIEFKDFLQNEEALNKDGLNRNIYMIDEGFSFLPY